MYIQPTDFCTPLWSANVARSVDSLSITQHGVPSQSLMEEAGRCVAMVAASQFQMGKRFIILCGPGNNGGDSIVAARFLRSWGFPIEIYCYKLDRQKQSTDLQIQLSLAASEGITPYTLEKLLHQQDFSRCIVIDGFLGIGLTGSLKVGLLQESLSHISSRNPATVIAIDLPSGLSSDQWKQNPPPLKADYTVTFGNAKAVHRLSPISQYCGNVKVFSIGFHSQAVTTSLHRAKDLIWEAIPEKIDTMQPWHKLSPMAHKFDRGHVLVIGGSPGKTGAPLLSAMAACKAGAGWVTIASPEKINQMPPYITSEPLFLETGELQASALADFAKTRKVKAMVIGPGMMQSPFDQAGMKVLQELSLAGIAMVIDAGALHDIGRWSQYAFNPLTTILTPHPGEFSRSHLGISSLEHFEDCQALQKLLAKWGISLLYKTSTPLLIDPTSNDRIYCYCQQNNDLAQAGSGDILAGIIASYTLANIPITSASLMAQHRLVQAAKKARKLVGHPTPLHIIDSLDL